MGNENNLTQYCINSFVNNGYIVNVWSYQRLSFINCIIKDANEIINYSDLPNELLSYFDISDWFRINLIYKIGGYYSDTDNYCLARFDEFNDSELVVRFGKSGFMFNNCFFRFSSGSKYLKYCIDNYQFNLNDMGYAQFHKAIKEHENELIVVDSTVLSQMLPCDSISESTIIIHLTNATNI